MISAAESLEAAAEQQPQQDAPEDASGEGAEQREEPEEPKETEEVKQTEVTEAEEGEPSKDIVETLASEEITMQQEGQTDAAAEDVEDVAASGCQLFDSYVVLPSIFLIAYVS